MLEPKEICKTQTIQVWIRISSRPLQFSARAHTRTHTHTQYKFIIKFTLKGKSN
jgi:hypothetical protein